MDVNYSFALWKTFFPIAKICLASLQGALDLIGILLMILLFFFDFAFKMSIQLVSMISPRELMQRGIPVFRAHQLPGEFIITFPAAFHAGFSHHVGGFFSTTNFFSKLGVHLCLLLFYLHNYLFTIVEEKYECDVE
jgi:hypothetical protein